MNALFIPGPENANAKLLVAQGGVAACTRGHFRERQSGEAVPSGALHFTGGSLAEIARRENIRVSVPLTPDKVVNWRMLAALELTPLPSNPSVNLLNAVRAAIAAMSDPQKTVLANALEGSDFDRNSPTVANIGAVLGLSSAQVDDVFRLAASFPQP